MDISFSKTINKGPGPKRLFVGGIHGKEGQTTISAFKSFNESIVYDGKLILHNFPESKYISTLKREYYDSIRGKELLELIKTVKPHIYLELHCYHDKNIHKLTNKNRKKDTGIPSLVELEEGVLMGAVSPVIRSVFFKKLDFPFILEIPCYPKERALNVYNNVINVAATSRDRSEILNRLKAVYPKQVEQLNKYFKEYIDNFYFLFTKTSQYARENGISTNKDLQKVMGELIKELNLDLNPLQVQNVGEAVLIFLKNS
jgi:hypothetical protein